MARYSKHFIPENLEERAITPNYDDKKFNFFPFNKELLFIPFSSFKIINEDLRERQIMNTLPNEEAHSMKLI